MKSIIVLILLMVPSLLLGKVEITKQEKAISKHLKKTYKVKSIEICKPYSGFMYYELYTKDNRKMIADSTGNVILPTNRLISNAYKGVIQFIQGCPIVGNHLTDSNMTNGSLTCCNQSKDVFLVSEPIGGGNIEHLFFSTSGVPLSTFSGELTKDANFPIFVYTDLLGNVGLIAMDGTRILPNDYLSINIDKNGICRLTQENKGIKRQGGVCLSDKNIPSVPCDFYYVDYSKAENCWKIKVHEFDSVAVYNSELHYNTSFLDEGQKLFESGEYSEARKFYTLNADNIKWAYFYIGASFYKESLELMAHMNTYMERIKSSSDRNDRVFASELHKNFELLTVMTDKAKYNFNIYLTRDTAYYAQTKEMLFYISERKNSLAGYKSEITTATANFERRCKEKEEMERQRYLRSLEEQRLALERRRLEEEKRKRELHEWQLRTKKQEEQKREQNNKKKESKEENTTKQNTPVRRPIGSNTPLQFIRRR